MDSFKSIPIKTKEDSMHEINSIVGEKKTFSFFRGRCFNSVGHSARLTKEKDANVT